MGRKITEQHIKNKLIELCVTGRKNDPVSSLSYIYNQVKQQIPLEHRLITRIVPKWLIVGVKESLKEEPKKPETKLPTLGEMIDKIISQIVVEITEKIETLATALRSHILEGKTIPFEELRVSEEPSKKLVKIALFGLLPNQQNELNDEFKGLVRLSYPKVRDFSKISPDYIILSRFNNHSIIDQSRRRLGRDKVFYLDGGVQSIKDKIMELVIV